MNLLFSLINAAAALAVFFCAVCQLARRQWHWRQPEMWAHVLLTGGSIAAAAGSLNAAVPLAQMLFTLGCAVYFVQRGNRANRSGHHRLLGS